MSSVVDGKRKIKAAVDAMIFVEAPSGEQLPKIAPRIKVPLLYNIAASGKTPFLTKTERSK
jgi:2-methylisocitrate lyase-like PEP mutase family enzyme